MMLKLITLFLIPVMLLSESIMKCEAGKCASGGSDTKKDIPKKENISQAVCH